MQIIRRNSNSTLVFTLKEKETLTDPYYLFELSFRGAANVVTTFIVADTSSYEDRYQQFLLTEVSTVGAEVLTSGTVNLPYVGEWHYRIFEQASSSNLNVADATTELENGIIRVIPETDFVPTVHQITDSSVIYNPTQT
jgi:hypothetical protein